MEKQRSQSMKKSSPEKDKEEKVKKFDDKKKEEQKDQRTSKKAGKSPRSPETRKKDQLQARVCFFFLFFFCSFSYVVDAVF